MAKTYAGPIVDVDVHHWWKRTADVAAYLPERWRGYFDTDPRSPISLQPALLTSSTALAGGGFRRDAHTPDGFMPGTDVEMTREQLLDRYGYFRAVLTHNLGDQPALHNQYLAADVCRALNEWTVDNWLARDDRLRSVILVPSATPELAAKEVRRLGGDDRFVSVLLSANPLGRPFGDPLYHPIYEAAAECDLPIAIHPSAGDLDRTRVTHGTASSILEYLVPTAQLAMHYVSSFIVHGVFERWPNLKVMIKEYGITWLPSVLWRLDGVYDTLRYESPWVKRWPSEYVHDHMAFSTQPLEKGPKTADLADLLGTVDGIEDMLCFSSDYPHFTEDDVDFVARNLPTAWHQKVFCGNACEHYDWEVPTGPWAPREAALAGTGTA
jgi:predicted TIM-barrel fold metal-dependent hydrolase